MTVITITFVEVRSPSLKRIINKSYTIYKFPYLPRV